jgi:hypothetical protein
MLAITTITVSFDTYPLITSISAKQFIPVRIQEPIHRLSARCDEAGVALMRAHAPGRWRAAAQQPREPRQQRLSKRDEHHDSNGREMKKCEPLHSVQLT